MRLFSCLNIKVQLLRFIDDMYMLFLPLAAYFFASNLSNTLENGMKKRQTKQSTKKKHGKAETM